MDSGYSRSLFVLLLFVLIAPSAAWGSAKVPAEMRAKKSGGRDEGVIVYHPEFFSVYSPVNALDMVDRLPGFQLQEGGGGRGFGGAAGNVLIDGERPSSKQDGLSEILSRIPAGEVDRIEIYRGETGALEARGQSVVVNVVLSEEGRAAWTWSAFVEQDLDNGGPEPGGSLSVVTRSGSTRYAAGIEGRHFHIGNTAVERLEVDERVAEIRDEFERTQGNEFKGNFNSETDLGRSVARFNGQVEYQTRDYFERSARTPQLEPAAPFNVNRGSRREEWELELGGDVQWRPDENLTLKSIALFSGEWAENESDLETVRPGEGPRSRQLAQTRSNTSESIARMEVDWTGWGEHFLELDVEGAFNVLDNELDLFVDAGDGFRPISVPGANARVEELRGDIQLSDSWQIDALSVEPALGAEVSRISQSGPEGDERTFYFFKPSLALIYAPATTQQTRVNLRREVAQLNFFDFVSAANFGDDEINLGNPSLKPQNTWVAELAHERRFGDIGAATAKVFYNHVRDLQDLLPIGDGHEVPGNIGDGRRWGLALEATLPLADLGWQDARVDVDMRWQRSRVEDPVTGLDRAFSGERKLQLNTELRHDLAALHTAWGLRAGYADESVRYELDELDINDQGVDLTAFIETTRMLGMKMRLTLENLLDRRFLRDRRVYAVSRAQPDLDFREVRDLRRGRSVILSLSGSF